jgi:hypothetical protein
MAGDVFSVISPVFDEQAALPRTLRSLVGESLARLAALAL